MTVLVAGADGVTPGISDALLTTGSIMVVFDAVSAFSCKIVDIASSPKNKVFKVNNGSNNLADPVPIPVKNSLIPPPILPRPPPKLKKVWPNAPALSDACPGLFMTL